MCRHLPALADTHIPDLMPRAGERASSSALTAMSRAARSIP
jgi:hypothetical protein